MPLLKGITIGDIYLRLERHEKSKGHICRTKSWIDLIKSIYSKTTTDSLNAKLIHLEKDRWVSMLKIIIYIVNSWQVKI